MPEYLVAWTRYRNGETRVVADSKDEARQRVRDHIEGLDFDSESLAILATREVREH